MLTQITCFSFKEWHCFTFLWISGDNWILISLNVLMSLIVSAKLPCTLMWEWVFFLRQINSYYYYSNCFDLIDPSPQKDFRDPSPFPQIHFENPSFQSVLLGWEDPLEKQMAFPLQYLYLEHGQRSLEGHSPWGHKVRHNWVTDTFTV